MTILLLRILAIHAPKDISRQAEQECVAIVVLLTHIGLILVDLYQKHKLAVDSFNFENISFIVTGQLLYILNNNN